MLTPYEFGLDKSEEAMKEWLSKKPQERALPSVSDTHKRIREDLQKFYSDNIAGNDELDDYKKDVTFAIYLYRYFKNMESCGFSLRVAEDDVFWRYLSLKVVPDLVSHRWENEDPEKNNGLPDHFFRKSVRIWLKSLWWYVHLSWNQTDEGTYNMLNSDNFSTDTILNLVERSGRLGTYVDVYRSIMYRYSTISKDTLSNYSKERGITLFRVVMKLNTAKLVSLNPELCLGGVKGYVKTLFAEAGVSVR